MNKPCTPGQSPVESWNHLSIIQRHKSRGIKVWYLRENSHGQIHYRSLGTTNKSVAQQCLQRLLVLRFALPWENPIPKDMGSLAQEFVSRPSLKKDSAEQYNRILEHFITWCQNKGIYNVFKIEVEDAQKYYLELHKKSARQRCRVCGIFLNWVYKQNRIDRVHPFKLIEYRKTVRTVRDSWNPEEVRRIVESAPDKELRMLWALMAYAGLRISEASNLTDDNIRGKSILVVGKGDKLAVLPIGKRLSEELALYGPLGSGLLISKQRSIRELKKVCQKLHIEGWVANHKFRHSFASNLAAHNCPVGITMRLMRHSSSTMTLDIYTHILQADLLKWVDAVDE